MSVHHWSIFAKGGTSTLVECENQYCSLCPPGFLLRLPRCCAQIWNLISNKKPLEYFWKKIRDSCRHQKRYFWHFIRIINPLLHSKKLPVEAILPMDLLCFKYYIEKNRVKGLRIVKVSTYIPGHKGNFTHRFSSHKRQKKPEARKKSSTRKIYFIRLPNFFDKRNRKFHLSKFKKLPPLFKISRQTNCFIDRSFPPQLSVPIFLDWKLKNACLPVEIHALSELYKICIQVKQSHSSFFNRLFQGRIPPMSYMQYQICHYCIQYRSCTFRYCPLEIFSMDFNRACKALGGLFFDLLTFKHIKTSWKGWQKRKVPITKRNMLQENVQKAQKKKHAFPVYENCLDSYSTWGKEGDKKPPVRFLCGVPSSYELLHHVPQIVEALYRSGVIESIDHVQREQVLSASDLALIRQVSKLLIYALKFPASWSLINPSPLQSTLKATGPHNCNHFLDSIKPLDDYSQSEFEKICKRNKREKLPWLGEGCFIFKHLLTLIANFLREIRVAVWERHHPKTSASLERFIRKSLLLNLDHSSPSLHPKQKVQEGLNYESREKVYDLVWRLKKWLHIEMKHFYKARSARDSSILICITPPSSSSLLYRTDKCNVRIIDLDDKRHKSLYHYSKNEKKEEALFSRHSNFSIHA